MEYSGQFKQELKSLDEIFGQENIRFRIPEYQRGYSWEERQRTDLLTDIEYIIKGEFKYRHYTGTIVASSNENETNERHEVFDIVDGQQRVTSLILLLSVICRFAKNSPSESKCDHQEIFSKFIQGGIAGNTVRKLTVGKDQKDIFESLVVEGNKSHTRTSDNTKSDQNLIDAVGQYEQWLQRRNLDDVLTCVREKLGFLFYAPENTKEIGIMFEVINNRGKALSELEKIKNYLIYYADKNDMGEIRDKVGTQWPNILRNLNKIGYTSNDSENQFLRNCWIVFMDAHKSRSHNVYDNLKLQWPPDDTQNTARIIEFIIFLASAAIYYAKYLKREGVDDENEKSWLERISYHPADASITPLILAIFSKVDDQKKRNKFLELLEKLNFRFYGTGIAGRSDSGQGELFEYANTFYNYFGKEKEGKKIDDEWLESELVNFVNQRANDASFVEHLTLDKDEAGDYYRWGSLKFFLASYEEELNRKIKQSIDLQEVMAPENPNARNSFYHKEHIWAVAERAVVEENKDNLDVNKRRLGNFMLLKADINKSVRDDRIEIKLNSYFKDWKNPPKTLMIRELKDLFETAEKEETSSENWKKRTTRYWLNTYKRFLDKREEKMINFALERWRIGELNGNYEHVMLDSLTPGNEIYKLMPDRG